MTTLPRDLANMSHYDFTGISEWNRIEGWFSLAKALAVQSCVKALPPGSTLVELGSYHGRSSVAIAAVVPTGSVLYCVDHFRGSSEHHAVNLDLSHMLESFLHNVERFGVKDRIRVLQAMTTEAAERFAFQSVDFILLDASHDFDAVLEDLTMWYPLLKAGGFLFCDDYDPRWPGVMQAVQAFGIQGELKAPALWMHQKPALLEDVEHEKAIWP